MDYTATFFPSKKSNAVEAYEIWRVKNPTTRPNLDPNKLATMRRTKSKYLSEMEIDEIKLKAQSKCLNWLPNVEVNNNNSQFDQHHVIQPNKDIESQNTPSLQPHVNPEQISDNVQCPQSQPELDEINELKERVLVERIEVQNIEITERNSLPKIRNTKKNQSDISLIFLILTLL